MFKLCFSCKFFSIDGYYCSCGKGKYKNIGFLTVNPLFFVRNDPSLLSCHYPLKTAYLISCQMIESLKKEIINKKKVVSSKQLKKLEKQISGKTKKRS